MRLAQERLFLQRFLDQAEQLFRRVRFADEVIGTALDRLDGVVQRIVRRQNDDLRVGMLALDLFEHFQAIRIGQLQIEQDNGRRIASQRSQSVRGGGGRLGLITVPLSNASSVIKIGRSSSMMRMRRCSVVITREHLNEAAYAASRDKGREIVVCRHERSET